MDNTLECKELSKRFGGVQALEDVTLSDIFESLVLVTRCNTSEDAVPRNLLPRRSLWDRNIEVPEDEVKIPFIASL